MDKTLTPSPWTILMDYPNGLPKWTTLKWTTPKKILFQMRGMLRSCDYVLTLHGGFVQVYCFKIGPYSSNKGGGGFDRLPYTESRKTTKIST